MARTTYYGNCALCGYRGSKAAMTRHLKVCVPKQDRAKGKASRLIHLRVEGALDPAYWLDVEIKSQAFLAALDDLLRKVWLECCGHMSAFEIGRVRYSRAVPGFFGGFLREQDMDVPVGQAMPPVGFQFKYEYDFGSTTELNLRVVSQREGVVGRPLLRLLARNEPPAWECLQCGNPATKVCVLCNQFEYGLFYAEHAAQHDCEGEGFFLPVVNSPRMGVCDYGGEAEVELS